jgi:hypothetical protein
MSTNLVAHANLLGHAISNRGMGQYSQQPYNGNDHKIHHSSKCFFEKLEWATMLH